MGRSSETPAELGYRWPAEWERHRATWLSWPHNRETWPGKFEPIPARFAELVRVLADVEAVHVLAGGEQVRVEAQRLVGRMPNVELIEIPTNDAWCRDHGPSFLAGPPDATPALVDWGYNAWGEKYPPFQDDDAVPSRIAELCGFRQFQPGVILEGGAVDTNGNGTLLASDRCLLNVNRNPELSRDQFERILCAYLGVTNVVWLARGELAGDDTDGHVDQLVRFVAPSTLVAAVESEAGDVNYVPLQENLTQLRCATDTAGRPFEVIPLPLPSAKFAAGQRLPASYCNFYVANGLVLVPQFSDPNDVTALGILREVFPDHSVRGLDATELILGLGAIHCLTQPEFDVTRD